MENIEPAIYNNVQAYELTGDYVQYIQIIYKWLENNSSRVYDIYVKYTIENKAIAMETKRKLKI